MVEARAKTQLTRLLALAPYLIANPGSSPDDVCRVFDIDHPTLESDLDLLWMCGVPPYDPFALIDVERDNEHITVSSADYFSRPVSLTVGEAQALESSLAILGDAADQGGALARLLAKVRDALGERARDELVAFAREPGGEPPVLKTLKSAVDARWSARITYYSASRDSVGERLIDPYRLLKVGGHWYVLAHCHEARDTRLFRLDRVEAAEQTSLPFEQRSEPDSSGYEAGVLYTSSPADATATIQFSPRAARWAVEAWPRERRETGPDGTVTIDVRYAGEAWIIRQILPYGPDAQIVGPRELARAFAETVSLLAQRYDPAPGEDRPAVVK